MANINYGRSRTLRGAGLLLIPCALLWLAGCTGGSSGGSDTPVLAGLVVSNNGGTVQNPTGNAACFQCHFSLPSNYYSNNDPYDPSYIEPSQSIGSGVGIGANYQKGIHNSDRVAGAPNCESCHGDGGQHFGLNPIPRWAPSFQQCGTCHTQVPEWSATAHSNPDQQPDKYFGQGGQGAAQAKAPDGSVLFQADGTTPVSKDQRIQECSVCHAYAQAARPNHLAAGDILDPPNVACGSCHDSHSPALYNLMVTTTRPNGIPGNLTLRLKPTRVNNTPGQPQYGANNSNSGIWVRPSLAKLWHPANISDTAAGFSNDAGYAVQATVVGDSLRLNSERLCASCHTQGNWKYTAFKGATPYTNTHNQDVFSQYLNSGHANKTDVPYSDFSLLAPLNGSHRPQYPIDMGKIDGRLNGGANNYACYQCHNGIGSIDYLNGTQGGLTFGDSQDAHILYGDSTTTCVTCHDPHDNGGQGLTQQNVRIPKYLSYNTFFTDVANPGHGNQRGGLNAMLDGTPIPTQAAGKPALLCLFCHQGRESGYTLYRNALSKNFNLYTALPAATVTASYTNAHYFNGGAQLWGKNSFEFIFNGTPQTYSNGIPQHLDRNCNGCHMAATTTTSEGGHTFKPNILTCRECHGGLPTFLSVLAPQDVDGDPTTNTVAQSFGAIDANVAPSPGTKGLFNILSYTLYTQPGTGIEYDPDNYPYFFKRINPYNRANHVAANGFTTWTAAQLEAAFNLGQLYKSGSAAYVHNYYYVSQILIDSLRALGVTTNPSTTNAFVRPTVPPGGDSHAATDYRTIVIP